MVEGGEGEEREGKAGGGGMMKKGEEGRGWGLGG